MGAGPSSGRARRAGQVAALYVCGIVLLGTFVLATPFVGAAQAACTPLAGAGNLDAPGCYELTTDVTDYPGDYAFQIQSSDVILDGKGFDVDGDGDTSTGLAAIRVDGDAGAPLDNVTIRNVGTVSEFDTGIRLEHTHDSTVEDLAVRGARDYGVRLLDSNDDEIRNVHATENGDSFGEAGISIESSDRTLIADSNVSANGADGVVSTAASGTVVRRTSVNRNVHGITLDPGSSNVVIADSTTNRNFRGLFFRDGSGGFATSIAPGPFLAATAGRRTAPAVPSDARPGALGLARAVATANLGVGYFQVGGGDTVTDVLVTNHTAQGNGDEAFVHDASTATGPAPNLTLRDVSLEPGATVTFQPQNVAVNASGSVAAAPGGRVDVGYSVAVVHVDSDVPSSLELTANYTDGDVSAVDESTLAWWVDAGGWTEQSSTVDPGANTVTASIGSYGSGGPTDVALFGNGSAVSGGGAAPVGDVDPDDVFEATDRDEEDVRNETSDEDTGDDPEPSTSVSVTRDGATTDTQVSVSDARPGESVSVEIPSEAGVGDVELTDVSVRTTTGGDFTIDVRHSPDPLPSSPAFELSDGTAPLSYLSIDHSIPNDDIEEVTATYRVDTERLEALDSSPEDVALYRFEDDGWVEHETTVVRRTAEYAAVRLTTDGLSEWTAAAKRPRLNVTDTAVDVRTATTDELVTIQVFVSNTGGTDGVYEARLLLNGATVDRRERTVPDGGTVAVTFERTFDQPGAYAVQVNDVFVGEVNISEADSNVEVRTTQDRSVEPEETDRVANRTATDGEGQRDGGGASFPVLPAGVVLVLAAGAGVWYYLTVYAE